MGYVRVKTLLMNPINKGKRRDLELLADTGAIYSVVPASVLRELDIEVVGTRKFKLASGEVKECPVGEVFIKVGDIGATSIVVFGSEDSSPILGVTALENLGLWVDPVSGELKPLELLLL